MITRLALMQAAAEILGRDDYALEGDVDMGWDLIPPEFNMEPVSTKTKKAIAQRAKALIKAAPDEDTALTDDLWNQQGMTRAMMRTMLSELNEIRKIVKLPEYSVSEFKAKIKANLRD